MGSPNSKEGIGSGATQTGSYLKAFEGHEDSITCLRITDKFAFTASRDGEIKIWSLKVWILETIGEEQYFSERRESEDNQRSYILDRVHGSSG
jgi:WD40 repeat protein